MKHLVILYYVHPRKDGVPELNKIKFSINKVRMNVIDEVESKIKKLKTPKQLSIRPIIISVHGVTREVEDMEYFDKIINFEDYLTCYCVLCASAKGWRT